MSSNQRGEESKLQRIRITCKTCGVSEYFYSNLSLGRFKLKHAGHEIYEGAQKERPPEARALTPEPQVEKVFEGRVSTRLSRVLVDLVIFPALPDPMFRIQGFKDGPEPAFTVTSPSRGNTKLQEFLDRGHYVDYGFSNLPYVWAPDAVEYDDEVRLKLGMPAKSAEARAAEPKRGSRDDLTDSDTSTVARTNEVLFDLPRGGEAVRPDEGRTPVPPPAAPVPREVSESPAPATPPQSTQEKAAEQPRISAPIPRPAPPSKREEKPAVERTPDATPRQAAEEDDDYLLVSKSWYIQGGTKNKGEAVRISKVLKAFRWKVEPLYTIGVILDDMLSIETSKNQVSRELIQAIENAGYRLTAVTNDQGKLAAWFKRSSSDAPNSPDSDVAA